MRHDWVPGRGRPALRGFRPDDLARLDARAEDRREMELLGDAATRAEAYAAAGPAFTATLDGEILFCAGAVELWPGVAEAWAVTAAAVDRRPVALHRAVLGLLSEHQPRWRCRRLQASVRRDHARAARWLHRLGFVYEGRMAGYGADGSDHLRFARLLPGPAPARAIDAALWTDETAGRTPRPFQLEAA